MVTKTRRSTGTRKSTGTGTGYRVKIITTTVSQGLSREAASQVARAAKAEIARRGVRGAKVSIVRGK